MGSTIESVLSLGIHAKFWNMYKNTSNFRTWSLPSHSDACCKYYESPINCINNCLWSYIHKECWLTAGRIKSGNVEQERDFYCIDKGGSISAR